jgi:hypothetical protein
LRKSALELHWALPLAAAPSFSPSAASAPRLPADRTCRLEYVYTDDVSLKGDDFFIIDAEVRGAIDKF